MLAGQAFANSPVAAVHALAYPIGGHFGVPHGLSNALVLPHVLRFNASACDGLLCRARAVCLSRTASKARATALRAFVEALAALSAELGLQPRLRDVGIPQDACRCWPRTR